MRLIIGRRRPGWPIVTAASAFALALLAWTLGHVGVGDASASSAKVAPSADGQEVAFDCNKPYTLKWASWGDVSAKPERPAQELRKGESDGPRARLDGLDVGEQR